ncbi:phenazine biosynthesis protein [bacterium M00.F.Ca.ET.228.01.1.1]|uniref:nuclear transport factor 2 family protein n=1 Tax=Paraburkholderia phenoliruptrix TaxID=252970 RepID=UPI001092CA3B|nr:nuclear transport factor 2 family protein [Paraburkholderia phenoliruptrix]TGP41482.1 phenazine biosynthesis protein [bacterium M00.F.Ca.ET.228.01.1.1]TGR98139.1 phenazine biosynthesis protein [bacterium M00.F.Ca.ET.191.01.1.1]TGU02330.1 phenazine biosynthesis protein [bacterium M00.F.Ca.ET.155.01.1.1]MBW0447128.1 nuclear transport factor 2 family protein [Paraburkholderia phenoliruptrix]MBW9101489.1 nuclear transport factor 2 family protein [Paraburkholderia phenoliruptrix]
MSTASDLLQQHLQLLVDDNAAWQKLIADDVVWELPYAAGIGHPTRLTGREEVFRHASWFVGALADFRFFDLRLLPGANPEQAVAQVRAEGLIKPTGRIYQQEYVVFLGAREGKIAHLREYFDPVQAAKALDAAIVGLD